MSISNLYTLVEEDFTFSGIHTIFACLFRFMHLESGEKDKDRDRQRDIERLTKEDRDRQKDREL